MGVGDWLMIDMLDRIRAYCFLPLAVGIIGLVVSAIFQLPYVVPEASALMFALGLLGVFCSTIIRAILARL